MLLSASSTGGQEAADAAFLTFGVALAIGLVVLIALLVMVTRLFRKVEQGKALIISKVRDVHVTFTGSIVLPVLHKAEIMDISLKSLTLERGGRDGLTCKDNIRADIKVFFYVRVNETAEDVKKVAKAIGTARASDQDTLQELFNSKFSEALKTVGKQFDFEESVPCTYYAETRHAGHALKGGVMGRIAPLPLLPRYRRGCSLATRGHLLSPVQAS